jgi:hypothetical protein
MIKRYKGTRKKGPSKIFQNPNRIHQRQSWLNCIEKTRHPGVPLLQNENYGRTRSMDMWRNRTETQRDEHEQNRNILWNERRKEILKLIEHEKPDFTTEYE